MRQKFKKRRGAFRKIYFLNKLLQIPSKSVKNCEKCIPDNSCFKIPLFWANKILNYPKYNFFIFFIFFTKLSLENTNWHQFSYYLLINWMFKNKKSKTQDSNFFYVLWSFTFFCEKLRPYMNTSLLSPDFRWSGEFFYATNFQIGQKLRPWFKNSIIIIFWKSRKSLKKKTIFGFLRGIYIFF